MKKLFLVLFLVLAIAISSPAWAANVVYKLTYSGTDDGANGTSGTIGYNRVVYGDVYNVSDTLVGHYYMTLQVLKPYTPVTGNQCFMTLHMVELDSGGPPWYNFTLQGSYAYGDGIGYGGITNITEFSGSLTGAYFTMEYNSAPSYYWTLTLHLP
jgi:hypothetical protein